MRNLLFVFTICFLIMVGCQKSSISTVPVNKSGVDVIIEDGGQFPEFLVGKWKGDKQDWELVFEPDGAISSVVIALGRFRITPGEITTVPMKMGGKSILEPGLWTVQYSPDSRELTVEIVLEKFHIEMDKNLIEGSSADIFTGLVSKSGKEWKAEWFNIPKYIVNTDRHKNYELPIDPNGIVKGMVIFEKIEETSN